jgi:hypothetical protein
MFSIPLSDFVIDDIRNSSNTVPPTPVVPNIPNTPSHPSPHPQAPGHPEVEGHPVATANEATMHKLEDNHTDLTKSKSGNKMASKLDLLYHFSTNYLIPAAFPHM